MEGMLNYHILNHNIVSQLPTAAFSVSLNLEAVSGVCLLYLHLISVNVDQTQRINTITDASFTLNRLTFVPRRWCPIRERDSPRRCRWAAAQTGSASQQTGLLDMDLRESQAEPDWPQMEPVGLQVTVTGLDPGGCPTEPTAEEEVVPEPGRGMNRQGL